MPELDLTSAHVFGKTRFSMLTPEVRAHLTGLVPERRSIVLFGIEAHVCVQQTALDCLASGYDVHLAVDGIGASDDATHPDITADMKLRTALRRMRQSGAFVTTSESVLFELAQDAKNPAFRDLQKLLKAPQPS